MLDPTSDRPPNRGGKTVPGLVTFIKHKTAVEGRMTIEPESQRRGGYSFIDIDHKSGLYQFLQITDLPDILYKPQCPQSGIKSEILHNKMDAILSKTVDGPLSFTLEFDYAPWILYERYLGHIVVGIIYRLPMFKRIQE